MSYTKRVLNPEDIVRSGEVVNVLVKEVDPDSRRISLSLREAEGDPWLEFQEKYSSGQTIEGVVEKKEKFGYFINLQPGVTGLLPKSKIKNSARPADLEKLKEGDTITTVIVEISHQDRKVTLSPGDAGNLTDWQQYTADRTSTSSLGEKLKAALEASKDKDRE
jgi:small subunit ribosomal protein S1